MRYCFDLDGTLCVTPNNEKGKPDYENSYPIPFMISQVNRLYEQGHHITIMTARGRGSGIDHTVLTKMQLRQWRLMYHELEPMFHKPTADLFVDDKGINVEEWKASLPLTKGIIGGAFDVIHPGYVRLFEEAKNSCNHLTVALHVDPSMERAHKMRPVHTAEEREEILRSLRNVDNVVYYHTESQFHDFLRSGEYDMRFLGSDYIDGSYTGIDIHIPIVWLSRDHGYSTTKLKTKIYQSIENFKREDYD